MGGSCSCCHRRGADDFEEQYQTLIRAKPAPVDLDSLALFGNSDDGDDAPEFQEVPTVDEDDEPPPKPKQNRPIRKKKSK
jgi:hypothetical protein